MKREIVVAVVDQGIDYARLRASVKANLYRNEREIAGNGRDDDRNGFVDDVTGPTGGPASNGYYQVKSGNHGMGMVASVSAQIDRAEAVMGGPLPVSIMPVSMSGPYYANIVAAAEAGASVISLSHDLSNAQKAYVSCLLEPYDVIAVTVDRDRPGGERRDVGEEGATAYDNVLEVALVSDARVRGNVHVDLLEVGSSLKNTSESHAIANAAGKVAAIWAVDLSRGAAEMVEIVRASTRDDHPTIQAQGLSSTMGGQIDLARGIEIARASPSGARSDGSDEKAPGQLENVERIVVDAGGAGQGRVGDTGGGASEVVRKSVAASGYTRGTAADEAFSLGGKQANVVGRGGDDAFVFRAFAPSKHVVRDFGEGGVLDLSALIDDAASPEEHVCLIEASWGGATHTKVMVEDDHGQFRHLATLHGAHGLSINEMIADQTLIL